MTERVRMTFPDVVDLHYVRDRHGLIWRVVRDGGMAATCDYSGKHWSMGIAALEKDHGPLVPVEPPVTLKAAEAADGVAEMRVRQVGWLGQTGRVYSLTEEINEPGGFSPIYIEYGD